jgi:hypothetical protein
MNIIVASNKVKIIEIITVLKIFGFSRSIIDFVKRFFINSINFII